MSTTFISLSLSLSACVPGDGEAGIAERLGEAHRRRVAEPARRELLLP